MENVIYDEILFGRILLFSAVGVLALVVGGCGIYYAIKNMRSEKLEFLSVTILCGVLILGSIIINGKIVVSAVHDITDQAYIVYDGTFIVDDSYERKKSSYSIFLRDIEEIKVEVERSILKANVSSAGEYNGTIVYAQKSRIVVDIKNINDK